MKLALLNREPEIFHSIQGEGVSIGRPAIFVRLAMCNLYCHWCDTDYTWNWEGTDYPYIDDDKPHYRKYRKQDHMADVSIEEIVARITAFPCNRIVLTGGEPLVQQKELPALLARLRELDSSYIFEVETNGTIKPSPELDRYIDQYNVSIKLAHSRVEQSARIRHDVKLFFATDPRAWFKFVVRNDVDIAEVIALMENFDIPLERVLCMPEGRSPEELANITPWLIEQCKAYGFAFSDRLHIRIWGSKKGV